MITKAAVTTLIFIASNTCAHAECDLARANTINNTLLPEFASEEFDSKVTERTDGALWSIYKDKSGTLERVIHTDYGESGRDVHKMTISDSDNFIITVHHISYLAPRDYDGSYTHREELDHYQFCESQLDLPPEWDEYDRSFPVKARKAADFFFTSTEIAKQLKAAGVTPPTWQ